MSVFSWVTVLAACCPLLAASWMESLYFVWKCKISSSCRSLFPCLQHEVRLSWEWWRIKPIQHILIRSVAFQRKSFSGPRSAVHLFICSVNPQCPKRSRGLKWFQMRWQRNASLHSRKQTLTAWLDSPPLWHSCVSMTLPPSHTGRPPAKANKARYYVTMVCISCLCGHT